MVPSIHGAIARARLGWLRRAALAALVALTMAGAAAAFLSSRPPGPGQLPTRASADAMPTGMDQAGDVPAIARAEVDLAAATLRRYALNLLLLPLLDDDVPPRWAGTDPDFTCLEEVSVRVDGQPIRVGEPLPGGPFVLEGRVSSCPILNPDRLGLAGSVTLHVFPDDVFGLTAVVELHGLRIRSHAGATIVLNERLAAREKQSGDSPGGRLDQIIAAGSTSSLENRVSLRGSR